MDASDVASALGAEFGGRVATFVRSPKRLDASLAAADLPEVSRWLRGRYRGCRLATTTGIDLRDGVGIFHHFAVHGSPLVVTLKAIVPKPAPRAPSLAPDHAAAIWIEREISDLLGVTFDGHPDPRPFLRASGPGDHPLRRGFDPAASREGDGERHGS